VITVSVGLNQGLPRRHEEILSPNKANRRQQHLEEEGSPIMRNLHNCVRFPNRREELGPKPEEISTGLAWLGLIRKPKVQPIMQPIIQRWIKKGSGKAHIEV
jgi:hypothetical protein